MVRSVAAVLPRYGKSLGGGAETLVRGLIERLSTAHGGDVPKVQVWTTCAMDHRTWANVLPPGRTLEDGIEVSRFPNDARDLDTFIARELAMRDGHVLTVEEQMEWLQSGVNSKALYQHIASVGPSFDAVLFAPYLFPTSFWGPLIIPENAILVPCLHDEHYAYQSVFRYVFSQVRGILFNAAKEFETAQSIMALPDLAEKSAVVGMGFDPVSPLDASKIGERVRVAAHDAPFLLYSGRKEQGKNLDLLIDYFAAYRAQTGDSLRMLLIGAGEIHFRESLPDGVSDLGFVSEEEKAFLMAEAVALAQPSTNESFSIVLMEAWQRGTPVLVHARCPVTRDHATTSGGGLFFADGEEFIRALRLLVSSPELRRKLGDAGRDYVATEYSWDAVTKRFYDAMRKFQIGAYEIDGAAQSS